MAVLLNELLEEASAECIRLSEMAKDTGEGIDDAVERASTLVSGLVAESERVSAGLDALAETLIEAEAGLQSAIDPGAAAGFQQIMERSRELRAQAIEFVRKVAEAVGELAQVSHQIRADVDSHMATVASDFQRVSEAMAQLEKLTAARVQSARTAIDALGTALARARDELAQAKGGLVEEIGQAETTARQQTAVYTGAIQTLLHDQTIALVGLANAMIKAHNTAVVEIRQKFAETVPDAMRAAAGDLKVAMQGLKEIGEDHATPLSERSDAIGKVVAQAVDALDRIRRAAASAGPP